MLTLINLPRSAEIHYAVTDRHCSEPSSMGRSEQYWPGVPATGGVGQRSVAWVWAPDANRRVARSRGLAHKDTGGCCCNEFNMLAPLCSDFKPAAMSLQYNNCINLKFRSLFIEKKQHLPSAF